MQLLVTEKLLMEQLSPLSGTEGYDAVSVVRECMMTLVNHSDCDYPAYRVKASLGSIIPLLDEVVDFITELTLRLKGSHEWWVTFTDNEEWVLRVTTP